MGDTEISEKLPVAIATITAGSCRVEYAASCYDALTHGNAAQRWLIVPCGPYLDQGRNDAVRQFNTQTPECEALLFVDTDVSFTPEDIHALWEAMHAYHAAHDVWPVIGGMYLSYSTAIGGAKIVAYRMKEDPSHDNRRRFFPLFLRDLEGVPEGALLEVEGLGTGFMMIHRSTLEHVAANHPTPQDWFTEEVVDGEWFGEDLMFCLRAKALGHPILAHSGVRLTHYKEIGLSFPSPDPKETP